MSLDEYESEDKPMQVDKVEYLDCINKVIHGDCLEVMQKIKPNVGRFYSHRFTIRIY